METGARGVSLASAPAPVVAEYSFAHATVTIQGMRLCVYVCESVKRVNLHIFCLNYVKLTRGFKHSEDSINSDFVSNNSRGSLLH